MGRALLRQQRKRRQTTIRQGSPGELLPAQRPHRVCPRCRQNLRMPVPGISQGTHRAQGIQARHRRHCTQDAAMHLLHAPERNGLPRPRGRLRGPHGQAQCAPMDRHAEKTRRRPRNLERFRTLASLVGGQSLRSSVPPGATATPAGQPQLHGRSAPPGTLCREDRFVRPHGTGKSDSYTANIEPADKPFR